MNSPRLNYVLRFIFERVLRIPFKVCGPHDISDEDEIILTYSPTPALRGLEGAIHLPYSGWLTKGEDELAKPPLGKWHDLPVLFPSKSGAIPFDWFSATFWMLARIEENAPFTPDNHGRFPATASFAFQNGFLEKPVVDIWAFAFYHELRERFNLPEISRPLIHIPTLDVDIAFAYKGRSFIRKTGGAIKDVYRRNWGRFVERIRVLREKKPDPFDNFDFFLKNCKEAHTDPRIFFLIHSSSSLDPNLSAGNKEVQSLLKSLNEKVELGIHPSYNGGQKSASIKREKRELSDITGKEVECSRQHFLRFKWPQTAHALLKAGIREDFSLGFADAPGFRAGTCTPFPFYDIQREVETGLLLYPLTVMDGTLADYMKLSPEKSLEKMEALATGLKMVGGTYVSLWHNHTFSNQGQWLGWREVFTHFTHHFSSN